MKNTDNTTIVRIIAAWNKVLEGKKNKQPLNEEDVRAMMAVLRIIESTTGKYELKMSTTKCATYSISGTIHPRNVHTVF